MELRDLVAALAIGCFGATMGAITAVAYPAVLALGAATVTALSCCTLLDRRERAVQVGVVCYGVLGTATLVAGLSPGYPAAIGLAILAGAAIALPATEVANRAGATIHAAKTGEGSTDSWRRSARALAWTIDRWRGDRRDRLALLAVPGLALALHVVVVASGAPVGLQAITLVPVAIAGFAGFALDSTSAFVAPGTAELGISTGVASGAPAAIADRTAGVGDRLASALDRSTADRTASDAGSGPADDGAATATTSTSDGGSSSARPSPAVSSDRQQSAADRTPSASDRTTSGATGTASAGAGTDSEGSLAACQNCGSEDPDRERRFVVAAEGLERVLCGDCQDARIETMRPMEACSSGAVRGAIASETSCAACGVASDLAAHPIVPLDAGGHRHPNNVLALCTDCHEAVDDHTVESSTRRSTETPTKN